MILFSRTPEEMEKRRLLRQISDLLKNRTPPYYRRFSAQVLPGFAEKLQEYVSLQQTICELLSKTINSEDAHLAERYWDHLAESRLTGTQEAQIHKFTYPEMKQITATTSNIERVLAELRQKFNQLIEGFDVSEFTDFEDDCTNLDRLTNLCRHDYSKIFKFFALKLSEPQQAPAPVNGEIILQELLDLYFIFSGQCEIQIVIQFHIQPPGKGSPYHNHVGVARLQVSTLQLGSVDNTVRTEFRLGIHPCQFDTGHAIPEGQKPVCARTNHDGFDA